MLFFTQYADIRFPLTWMRATPRIDASCSFAHINRPQIIQRIPASVGVARSKARAWGIAAWPRRPMGAPLWRRGVLELLAMVERVHCKVVAWVGPVRLFPGQVRSRLASAASDAVPPDAKGKSPDHTDTSHYDHDNDPDGEAYAVAPRCSR